MTYVYVSNFVALLQNLLLLSTERNDSHCLVSRTGRSISHGVVCYTGTTPGSTAYTLCDEGYNFNDEKMRKPTECLENGQWNGTQPQCTRHNTSSTGKGKHKHFIS